MPLALADSSGVPLQCKFGAGRGPALSFYNYNQRILTTSGPDLHVPNRSLLDPLAQHLMN